VLLSALTLFWQLFILFACCSGIGLFLRFLLPKEFSLLNKMLFSSIGGLFLVVLIPQNLVYLGIPVRISAWLILGAALAQLWWWRHSLVDWSRSCCANSEIRALAALALATITFHAVVPIEQGLEWYYGKGYPDQRNYVFLAEFLKEVPYGTSLAEIGLRPWLLGPVGFQVSPGQGGMSPRAGVEGHKKQRIGQSLVTAEMSVWSGTNGKGGYAATVIFFLTLLAISLYALLRDAGIDRFMALSGALLAAILPVVTRLSLDGFLSQTSVLFVFPFFARLVRHQELSSRSFTLFFSLTLAYLIAVYSEIAPIGFCTLFLGIFLVRRDKFPTKRLMLMSAVLLTALMNLYYLRNLIELLGQQYFMAVIATFNEQMAPKLLTLRAWSELIFGPTTNTPFDLLFDYCTLSLGLLCLAGIFFLSSRDRLVFGAILLPPVSIIFYLASRTPPLSYPIAKITLTILPCLIGLVFVGLSRVGGEIRGRPIGVLKKLISGWIVGAAAAGSLRYYAEVFKDEGLLRVFREPRFLDVCRQLEAIKNKRVLVFESHSWITPWLCYHARHNDVYVDSQLFNDSLIPPGLAFTKVPDLKNADYVATRNRVLDLRAPSVSCLTSVDDTLGEDLTDGHDRYALGPPIVLRFLAVGPISANLKLRLVPGFEPTTFPVDYLLTDNQGHVYQGAIRDKGVDIRRMNFPRGLSTLQLSVKEQGKDPNIAPSSPIIAELDQLEISDVDWKPGD
jgi:hypothetical protein